MGVNWLSFLKRGRDFLKVRICSSYWKEQNTSYSDGKNDNQAPQVSTSHHEYGK